MTTKMKKFMPVLLSTVALALVIASCGGDDDTPTRVPVGPTVGPTATAAPTSTPVPTGPSGSLNSAQVTLGNESYIPRMMGPTETIIASLLWDPAFGISRTDGISIDTDNGLVQSYEITVSGDNVDLAMNIRPNIPFHNGEGIFTADDFRFSYEQMIREGGLFANVGNMQNFANNDINNMEVVNDTTVILHSTRDWAIASMERNIMAQGLLSQAHFERVGGEEQFKLDPTGTGPWQFLEHRVGEFYRVEAVLDHWLQEPDFEILTLLKVPEPATQIAQLLAGQVDIVSLTPRQIKEVEGKPNVGLIRSLDAVETYIVYGGLVLPEKEAYDPTLPWTGPDLLGESPSLVREAMSISIDRQAIVDRLLFGEGRVAAVPYFFDNAEAPWYNPRWTVKLYDPAKAKQNMIDAGFEDGFTIKSFVFGMTEGGSLNGDIQEAIAGFWEDNLGVTVERIVTEYRPTVRTRLFDRTTAGFTWTFTQGTATDVYNYFSGSCCFNSRMALGHWEIPQTDELIWAAEDEFADAAYRYDNMRQVGDFIYDNHIGFGIARSNIIFAIRDDKISGWDFRPLTGTQRDFNYVKRVQ